MPIDYSILTEEQLSIVYYREKILTYDPSRNSDVSLLYGDNAKKEYFRLVNEGLIDEGSGGGGGGNLVTSVAGKVGAVSLVKADVGLSNVDNTADTAKPVSTAQQTALDGKAAASHTHTLSQISDASTLGRQLASVADAATARSLTGAGTSNLALGTSGSTAKAGNYAPTITDAPAGSVFYREYVSGAWQARGSARTDIHVGFIAPRSVTATPPDKVNGMDFREFNGD